MADQEKTGWRGWGVALAAFLLGLALAASFLPLIETNTWWIRYMDFPRLQFAIAIVVLWGAFLVLRRRAGPFVWMMSLLAALALGYHAYKLYPYSPLPGQAAASVEQCPAGAALTIMVANVQAKNEQADALLRIVAETDPDLLLVLETDPWWDRHLSPLKARFAEAVQSIPEGQGAFGMHLFSKHPLVSPEFRFLFDAYTPALYTGVALPDGAVVQFLGVHPHPPLWWQPSTLRDASLLSAAIEARASEAPTIVAGDFNSVPWEPVTRRAARIGGLLDPRIGRGFRATFRVGNPLMTWPLDQILYETGFGLLDLEVLPAFGSDHYPIAARLCHLQGEPLSQAAPAMAPDDLREAERSIEAARARDSFGSEPPAGAAPEPAPD